MEPSENNKTVTKKKTGKKILKIVAGIVVVLLLLVILLVAFIVPAYVSSESGRKMILSKANGSGVGVIDFAKLSMSWFKGISVTNISFKNADQGLTVAVKGVSTKPDYGALSPRRDWPDCGHHRKWAVSNSAKNSRGSCRRQREGSDQYW